MNLRDKDAYKTTFKTELDKFALKLEKYVSSDNGDWTVKGFIDVYKNIYTISADTKIISKILEIHIFPQLLQFADDNGYKIIFAEKQNWYPDITFVDNKNNAIKFALDIKTTFRRNNKTAGFTLGSHERILRNETRIKIFSSPITSIWGIIVLELSIQEPLQVKTSLKQTFSKLQSFKKNMIHPAKKWAKEKLRL